MEHYTEESNDFFREKDILQLSLTVIARLSQIRCRDNEIYIVENPSVFAMICEEKSCMCMNGQPRLSCLEIKKYGKMGDQL